MPIATVEIFPWENPVKYYYDNLELSKGDSVIVKYDNVLELGQVLAVSPEASAKNEPSKNGGAKEDNDRQIIRKASPGDLAKSAKTEDRDEALKYCAGAKKKHNLQMKFVDVHFSFEGSRITFAFIAEGRVDFRELVKDLTRHFGRTIRLQQIGIRDEAKVMGDFGHCGRELCCRKFLKNLTSITSEMAEMQQCSHRGSERISGICGRLMCCLVYEQAGYEALIRQLLPIGSKITVEGKKAMVVGHNILKQTIKVEIAPSGNGEKLIVEVDKNKKIIK